VAPPPGPSSTASGRVIAARFEIDHSPELEVAPDSLAHVTKARKNGEIPPRGRAIPSRVRQRLAVLTRKPALATLTVGLALGAAGGSLVTARLSSGRDAIFIPVQGEALQPPAAAAPGPSAQVCPWVASAPAEAYDEATSRAPRAAGRRVHGMLGTSPSTAASIADEVGLLDAAREALARGDSDDAIRVLNAHSERFGAGALVQEADVLRVQALIESGERSEATDLAKQYLTEHGDSPHANRVRTLMNQAEREEQGSGSSKKASVPRNQEPDSP